jgi:hypothetical protein
MGEVIFTATSVAFLVLLFHAINQLGKTYDI